MKKFSSLILLLALAQSSFAQFSGDGYYRVQNVGSKRYIRVEDNKGSVNLSSTTADMGAVVLYKRFTNVESNPASVIYIKKIGSGTDYDLYAQGTSTYDIIGYHVDIIKSTKTNGAYRVYGTKSGLTKWLCDGERSAVVDGVLNDNDGGKTNFSDWYILPIEANKAEAYFGVQPQLELNGKYYAAFYADFPFSFVSSGMKAYYVSALGNNKARLEEISGTVPARTPVIIECSSNEPINNQLNIAVSNLTAPTNNRLRGVFFHNTSNKHRNLTAYDANTMRVLGITADGHLGFVKATTTDSSKPNYISDNSLQANRSYLPVATGSASDIRLMTAAEYSAGIGDVRSDKKFVSGIYTTTGVKLSDNSAQLDNLQPGIYIVDGQKVVIR